MWSKGPFKSRRNPTSSPSPSPPGSRDKHKGLPPLPSDSGAVNKQVPSHDMKKRYSDVSSMGSPDPGHEWHGSQSSFCVSPMEEGQPFPPAQKEYRVSSAPSPISMAGKTYTASQSTLQPVQHKLTRFTPERPADFPNFAPGPHSTIAGKTPATSSHKPSGSHTSNLLTWGREQLRPIKRLNETRTRMSSFSKSEEPSPELRTRSSSRALSKEVLSKEAHSNRATEPSPQIGNLGFVPSTVTTISAGDPAYVPTRPATDHAPSHPRPDPPTFKFDDDDRIASMMLPSNEPASRFSGTTDTTTDSGSQNASPRVSFQLDTRSTDDLLSASSIMSRRRPVPNGIPISKKSPVAIAKKPVRKPTPSQVAQMPAENQTPPPAPEEPKDAQGRIEALEAKRNELAQRRFTLQTVVDELSKVIQPTSIAYDLASKAEVKKSLQSIGSEIDEIKKEEHDLGMKIARAWRRFDEKENNGDGNSLWVKRVTS
ncbi:hypothetical protein N7522_001161 [Penicillium canescens]|uniref:Uncharacterized protein n=1 Tax=Penicillium canescens TaxID=5083 RepID=A0AAD6IPE4_PENCN|nr:uncharacterized protein N7446_008231 [Penicillium canescens]KAJ6019094.1 hypothetical protein N7522_001161 [Penicillium canescens]KAJ6033475.1 hypothetical protein N7444_011246 [Penicillium canescens]KAJ6057333.1 hypothetical protein N7460_000607 [Penicillium canescens]KAJ6058648.1 hypothetical protein N7446_008231 [Penicillium canescens]